jgi:hypothetical protein
LKLVEQNDLVLISLAGEMSAIRALMEHDGAIQRCSDGFRRRFCGADGGLNHRASVCTVDGHFGFFRKSSGEIIALLAPFP